MLLWFLLTAASVMFVTIDIRRTPESPVLKWGFVLLTVYTGPFGAFLYVLGCREPLPGLHEQYVAIHWRQALGATMHCLAGDGVGILAGAVIASLLTLPPGADIALEYALGFGFGWTVFQSLFMRGMAGGSYGRSLRDTFIPELLSMNCLMAGMVPIAAFGQRLLGTHPRPLSPEFWFLMSMALLIGFTVAYPMNAWLVARGLKHGMMTVRPHRAAEVAGSEHGHHADLTAAGATRASAPFSHSHESSHGSRPSPARVGAMTALSLASLGSGIVIALLLGGR